MRLGDHFPQVIEAARTGAEWSWALLYRELAPVVLGYLRTRGATEPEDVTGEVFLQVVRDLRKFDGDERDFRAWVVTIAHHRLLDEQRRRARRPVEPAPDELLHGDVALSDTAAAALAAVNVDRIRSLIGRLSPDQQDVLLLRLLGDLTVDEVARAIGKRPGAVKALQRRGLAALRREIEKEGVTL